MGDPPPDSRDQLRDRFEEVARASERRDPERAVDALAAAEEIVARLSRSADRAVLEHGSERVRVLVRDEPLVAAEWARAMARRLESERGDGGEREDGQAETDRRPRDADGDGTDESRRDRSDETD